MLILLGQRTAKKWLLRKRRQAAAQFGASRTAIRLDVALSLGSPVLFAVLAVLLGKEAGWDFLNYHWYNAYALLHQRLGVDVAVAHHATYYNPLIDVPLYLVANIGPAWLGGALLGMLFGIAVSLIGTIAYTVLAFSNRNLRLGMATLLALLGALGGGAVSSLGNSANDATGAIGVLAALWLLLNYLPQLRDRNAKCLAKWRLLLAGVLAGMSVGLKLTMAPYAIGLIVACVLVAQGYKKRLLSFALPGLGAALGFCLCGGYWLWRMWHYSGNPLFPYLNQWFRSSLLMAVSYRDASFVPTGWREVIMFPYLLTLDSLRVAEWTFRDMKLLMIYVLLPVSALMMLRPVKPAAVIARSHAAFLFCFAALSYGLWLSVFAVYRYLIPLEMLAPLLIVIAICQWPLSNSTRVAVAALLLASAQLTAQWNVTRDAWRQAYVQVKLPPLAYQKDNLLLMAGTAPMAFVIPSFPPAIAFLRIDGWLVGATDTHSGLALQMRRRVAEHAGPMSLLFAPYDAQRASNAAHAYGLVIQSDSCALVRSNVAEPLQLCSVQRL